MWPTSLTSAPRVPFCAVTNYNNVVEARSDSDDEDKLHIVEEEGSLADGADCDSTLPDDEHPRGHCWDRGENRHSLTGRIDINHTSAQSHAKQTCRLPAHHFHTVLWLRSLHFLKSFCFFPLLLYWLHALGLAWTQQICIIDLFSFFYSITQEQKYASYNDILIRSHFRCDWSSFSKVF